MRLTSASAAAVHLGANSSAFTDRWGTKSAATVDEVKWTPSSSMWIDSQGMRSPVNRQRVPAPRGICGCRGGAGSPSARVTAPQKTPPRCARGRVSSGSPSFRGGGGSR